MKILSIEIMSNSAGMLLIDGDKNKYEVTNLGKNLSIPKADTTIQDFLTFQTNFANFLKEQTIDAVSLCEGGKDSKKMRVRMEFLILAECEKQTIECNTYPTGSCTRLINSTYKKETGKEFAEDLKSFKLPKYMGKTLVAGWRFLE